MIEGLKNTIKGKSRKLDRFLFKKKIASAIRSNSGICSNGWFDGSFEGNNFNIDKRKRIIRNEIAKNWLKKTYGDNIKTIFDDYNGIYAYEIRNIAERLRRINGEMPDFEMLKNEILYYYKVEKICFNVYSRVYNAECAIKMEKLGERIEETRLELYNNMQNTCDEIEKIYLECKSKRNTEHPGLLYLSWKSSVQEIKSIIIKLYVLDKNELKNKKGRENVFNFMFDKEISDSYNGGLGVVFYEKELVKKFSPSMYDEMMKKGICK